MACYKYHYFYNEICSCLGNSQTLKISFKRCQFQQTPPQIQTVLKSTSICLGKSHEEGFWDMLMSNFLTWVLITQICSVNALFFNKKVFKFWGKIDLFKTN